MFVLGITGGIGSGKSTVASICRAAGLTVIDADQIAREVTEKPSETTRYIEEIFGSEIIREDGALDRQRMSIWFLMINVFLTNLARLFTKK